MSTAQSDLQQQQQQQQQAAYAMLQQQQQSQSVGVDLGDLSLSPSSSSPSASHLEVRCLLDNGAVGGIIVSHAHEHDAHENSVRTIGCGARRMRNTTTAC
jgi:hypothetical protein